MLRSFLARPHPLLAHHLRRHERRRSVAQLGHHTDGIPWRRYTSSEDESHETTDTEVNGQQDGRRKHLYVVLDDWKKGFSIHKLDLDDGGGDLTQRAPLHRQSNEHCYWSFAALGKKIIAAGKLKFSEDDYVTLAYDTETAGMSFLPRPPTALRHGWGLSAAAGNRLYTVVNGRPGGGVHCLEDAEDQWSWSSIPSPLPFGVSLVESIAVHPEGGGRKVFVSMGQKDHDPYDMLEASELGQDMESRTYSYDMGSGEWRGHGDWDLPFYGQAHYNGGLDAWVGLHKKVDPHYGVHSPDRHICSCDVVPPTGCSERPAWKLCTERLSDAYPNDGSLVYMGDSTYCLVEVVEREKFRRRRCANTGNKCMIRLTTFRLKYGKNGELTMTARWADRSYLFSRYGEYFEVRASWI